MNTAPAPSHHADDIATAVAIPDPTDEASQTGRRRLGPVVAVATGLTALVALVTASPSTDVPIGLEPSAVAPAGEPVAHDSWLASLAPSTTAAVPTAHDSWSGALDGTSSASSTTSGHDSWLGTTDVSSSTSAHDSWAAATGTTSSTSVHDSWRGGAVGD